MQPLSFRLAGISRRAPQPCAPGRVPEAEAPSVCCICFTSSDWQGLTNESEVQPAWWAGSCVVGGTGP